MIHIAASMAPTVATDDTTIISIIISWGPISDSNGYVVFNGAQSHILESSQTSIALDGLMSGMSYSISVRAYRNISGPATTLDVVTDNGE